MKLPHEKAVKWGVRIGTPMVNTFLDERHSMTRGDQEVFLRSMIEIIASEAAQMCYEETYNEIERGE